MTAIVRRAVGPLVTRYRSEASECHAAPGLGRGASAHSTARRPFCPIAGCIRTCGAAIGVVELLATASVSPIAKSFASAPDRFFMLQLDTRPARAMHTHLVGVPFTCRTSKRCARRAPDRQKICAKVTRYRRRMETVRAPSPDGLRSTADAEIEDERLAIRARRSRIAALRRSGTSRPSLKNRATRVVPLSGVVGTLS